MADNSFENIMKSLLEGTDGALTSRTVMGTPVQVGETTIIPLSDVTIGYGGGSNNGADRNSGTGGFAARMSPAAVLIISEGTARIVHVKDQSAVSRIAEAIPEVVDRISAARARSKSGLTDEEAVDAAFDQQ